MKVIKEGWREGRKGRKKKMKKMKELKEGRREALAGRKKERTEGF
jgi:hypothetical protein